MDLLVSAMQSDHVVLRSGFSITLRFTHTLIFAAMAVKHSTAITAHPPRRICALPGVPMHHRMSGPCAAQPHRHVPALISISGRYIPQSASLPRP